MKTTVCCGKFGKFRIDSYGEKSTWYLLTLSRYLKRNVNQRGVFVKDNNIPFRCPTVPNKHFL